MLGYRVWTEIVFSKLVDVTLLSTPLSMVRELKPIISYVLSALTMNS